MPYPVPLKKHFFHFRGSTSWRNNFCEIRFVLKQPNSWLSHLFTIFYTNLHYFESRPNYVECIWNWWLAQFNVKSNVLQCAYGCLYLTVHHMLIFLYHIAHVFEITTDFNRYSRDSSLTDALRFSSLPRVERSDSIYCWGIRRNSSRAISVFS